MHCTVRNAAFIVGLLANATYLTAQPAAGPDVLLLVDGEKLIGHLLWTNEKVVTFKSDAVGRLTVPWPKVKELHAAEKFAAIPKGVPFKTTADAAKVPQGPVDVKDQKVEVAVAPAPAAPTTVPLAEVGSLVGEGPFLHALGRQGLLEGWTGGVNFGLVATDATTSSVNENFGFNLVRSDPSEGWLDVRSRTTLSFFQLYTNTMAPYSPSDIVSVFQANAVHDFYLTQRTYAFGGVTFEHTSPQGLDLLQAYGGGLGFVLVKNNTTNFEVRGGLGYMHQSFEDPALNRNLIGSRFGEDYSKTFKNGISIDEQAGIRPAWNYSKAFFAGGNITVTFPVYKRLAASLGANETFVNNPPPYFKKNNFRTTIGLHYTLK